MIRSKRTVMGVGLASLVLGVSILTGCAATVTPHADAEVSTSPKASDSEAPQPAVTVAQIEIPSNTAPEELPAALAERLSSWLMAGTTPDVYDEYMAFEGTVDEFAQQQAAEYAPVFAQALFGSDWESDDGYVNMANGYQDRNAYKLAYWLVTAEDEVPYAESITVVSSEATSADDTSTSVHVVLQETNNAAENKIGTTYHPELIDLNGNQWNATATFTRDGDVMRVTDYTIVE